MHRRRKFQVKSATIYSELSSLSSVWKQQFVLNDNSLITAVESRSPFDVGIIISERCGASYFYDGEYRRLQSVGFSFQKRCRTNNHHRHESRCRGAPFIPTNDNLSPETETRESTTNLREGREQVSEEASRSRANRARNNPRVMNPLVP